MHKGQLCVVMEAEVGTHVHFSYPDFLNRVGIWNLHSLLWLYNLQVATYSHNFSASLKYFSETQFLMIQAQIFVM